jgi:hypothetical protein
MAHYRRCLEQASFESHDSLVDRVGFKRRAKSASWLVVAVVGKNTTGMASVTDAPPIGVNVSPWRCCFNDNAVDYDDRLHRGLSTGRQLPPHPPHGVNRSLLAHAGPRHVETAWVRRSASIAQGATKMKNAGLIRLGRYFFGTLPLPVSFTDCGSCSALSMIVRVAFCGPGSDGANMIPSVHVPPGLSDPSQSLLVTL